MYVQQPKYKEENTSFFFELELSERLVELAFGGEIQQGSLQIMIL
jgi:hypothetical protein